MSNNLDAHAKPPAEVREVYKSFQKADRKKIEHHPDLINTSAPPFLDHRLKGERIEQLPNEMRRALLDFLDQCGNETGSLEEIPYSLPFDMVSEVKTVPGKLREPECFSTKIC